MKLQQTHTNLLINNDLHLENNKRYNQTKVKITPVCLCLFRVFVTKTNSI